MNYNITIDSSDQFADIKVVNRRIAFPLRHGYVFKGYIRCQCLMNRNVEVYGIELDDEVEGGTYGTFNDFNLFECKNERGVLVKATSDILELDEKTDVVMKYGIDDIVTEEGNIGLKESVQVHMKDGLVKGTVIHSGKINNIFCYAVELEESASSSDDPRSVILIEKDITQGSIIHTEKDITQVPKPVYPLYNLPFGGGKGIQGNLNSCYLDTSLFAIFSFNVFLDNMLLDKRDNKETKELQSILRDEIVYTLRRDGYVPYTAVAKFRDKLQSLSPGGNFVIDERDPEELLERLFQLLTPTKFVLRTKLLQNMDNVQKCFLTQLFYQSMPEKTHITLFDMFTMTFLEFQMLIEMPPKCLILQLARDGRELKQFKKVAIPSKLDITPFIINTKKKCKDCSSTGIEFFFCEMCSKHRVEITYYCKDHNKNCTHEKRNMPYVEQIYNGPVVMDLVAILCIEKTHYVTFVKTNEVNERWIYFNSMENIENGRFIPLVRDTNLHQYFSKGYEERSRLAYDKDVDKIENYAFVIIYKNPALEFYGRDFNSD